MLYDIRNLQKERRAPDRTFVLEVPVFRVSAGEFVAIQGFSGCGKSTLLDLLGLISMPSKADKFEVGFSGVAARTAPGAAMYPVDWANEGVVARIRREKLGYILQTGGLLPYLSVYENARLARALAGLPGRGAANEAIFELATRLGIERLLHAAPARLSGGQRQRAALLRALAHRPSVVLADEPTASVDRPTAVQIVSLLSELAGEAESAVIMVTHDHALIRPVAQRVYQFELHAHEGTTHARCIEHVA